MTNKKPERWACIGCGRLFTDNEIRRSDELYCPSCGYTLRKWHSFNSVGLLIAGAVGLPLLGRLFIEFGICLGLTSSPWRNLFFFLIPAGILILGLFESFYGSFSSHPITKRGGYQLLILFTGFIVSVLLLIFAGIYAKLVGTG
jgi:hypothetical protein